MPEYKSPQSEPGMHKNILLLFLLMAVAIFGAQYYMRKYSPKQPEQQKSTAEATQQPIQPGATSSQPAAAQAAPAPAVKRAAKGAGQQPATREASSESETVIENG